MIRLLRLLFENPMMLMHLLPALILLIFSFVIAKFCVRKFQNGASNLMMVGVVLQGIQFIYIQLLNHVIIESVGYEHMTLYYGIGSVLFLIAEGLFLYGLWKLVQGLAELQEDEEAGGMGGLFLKK